MYYPINEELARRAKESYSHFDYDEGSATYYYRKKVDEAYAIAEEAKKTVESEYHAKIVPICTRENLLRISIRDTKLKRVCHR